MDWSSGYVADINYSGHYYQDLNPVRLALALINAGYNPPKIENACELGFGFGISVNVHAAAQGKTRWFGTDFLPQQAQFAQKLSDEVGSNAVLSDQSFAEFCARDDLPDFDYICLHGIWSWVTDSDRDVLVDFIRRKLRVGGVAYISYNVMPGWSSLAPVRELLALHAKHYQAPAADSLTKVEHAFDFVQKLVDVDAGFFAGREELKKRFEFVKGLPKTYLAHEYFNRNWKPVYFSDVADVMSQAKMTFATTTGYHELLDELWMTPAQKELAGEAPNSVLYQQLRDFMVNQQFRKDIWIKGGESIDGQQSVDAFSKQRILLNVLPETIEYTAVVAGNNIVLQESIYKPIFEFLMDYKVHSVQEIIDVMAKHGVSNIQVMQAVIIIMGLSWASIAQTDEVINLSKASVMEYNRKALERTRYSGDQQFLASCITGGGFGVDNLTLRILDHICLSKMNNDQVAELVAQELKDTGRVIQISAGKPATNEAESAAAIATLIVKIRDVVLPHYKALGMIIA